MVRAMGEPAHIPRKHDEHDENVPCGCSDGTRDYVKCQCGAAYEASEVMIFARWKCYDCGRCISWPCQVYAAREVTHG